MTRPRKLATTLLPLLVGLIAIAPPARAEELAADISIRSVRLTDRLVLRIQADYVCPLGFAVQPSRLPRAYASQQDPDGGSSQYKKFGEIVCDGVRHDVLVRFVRPRHTDTGVWAVDALTQVSLNFQAIMSEAPYSSVSPSDVRMVITRAARASDLVADLTIRRIRLNARQVLHVRASTLCPVGLRVRASLPPRAYVSQGTSASSQKVFGGIVCDGVRHPLVLRLAGPRSPDGAAWQAGAMTHVYLNFQASAESPYRYVLATDAQDAWV